MNYYLLAMLLYALFIAPITAELMVSGGDGVRYRLLVRFAGVAVFTQSLRVREREDQLVLRQRHVFARRPKPKRLSKASVELKALLPLLAQPRVRQAMLGAVRLLALRFTLDISSPDAAATALGYSAVNLLWRVAQRVRPRAKLSGHVSADFEGKRTCFSLMGIVQVRLGKMLLVAVALLWAKLEARKGKQAYATSH